MVTDLLAHTLLQLHNMGIDHVTHSARAWAHTVDDRRLTVTKNDISMAVNSYDQFDFLIDIVPEIKPTKGKYGVKTEYRKEGF